MDLTNKILRCAAMAFMAIGLTACSVSYKFNGASIDYTKTKTIQIAEFPIRSSYVWGPMGALFNNELKAHYLDHTRLVQVKRNGDLKTSSSRARLPATNSATSQSLLKAIRQ